MRSQQYAIQPLDILRGSVLHYDDPVDPIEECGWEAPRHDPRIEGARTDTPR